MRAPAYARPGQPEGAWWHPLVYLAALLSASAIAWALIAGAAWFVLVYTVVAATVIVALAVVVLAVSLALKRGWRPKLAALALSIALAALVFVVIGG